MINQRITLAQAVRFLAEQGRRSPQGKPFATSTLQKAARQKTLAAEMIGKTYVTTTEAALAWAQNADLHNAGRPKSK